MDEFGLWRDGSGRLVNTPPVTFPRYIPRNEISSFISVTSSKAKLLQTRHRRQGIYCAWESIANRFRFSLQSARIAIFRAS